MRNALRFMLAAGILAATTAAASAGLRQHSWVKSGAIGRAGSGPLVFAADFTNNVVNIYSGAGQPVGQIAGYFNFPQTLAVDAAENLYVYNGRTNSIFEFAPPYTGVPVKRFFDGLDGATQIAIDASGTVYAAVFEQIVEYPHGSTRPSYINLPVAPSGVTLDPQGHLVSTFTAGGSAGVMRVSRNAPIPESLQIPIVQSPADVLYDSAGNMVVESNGGAYINIYAPGKTKPLATWSTGYGFISPNHMAFSADGATLYVSDQGSNALRAFSYPGGQQQWQVTGFGNITGVAVSPALVPGGTSNAIAPFPAAGKAPLGRPVPPLRAGKNLLVSLAPQTATLTTHPAWARFADPHARRGTSPDLAWVAPIHFGAPVQQYTLPNDDNAAPNCATPLVYGINNIGLDPAGNLWVPAGNNGPRTGTVQQYACAGSLGRPITDTIGQPSDVAFDGKGNTIVGDIVTYLPDNGNYYISPGTANAYDANGALIGTLTDPTFFSPHPPGFDNFNILDGVATDAAGNCYVSHVSNSGGGEVVEFPACKPAKRGNVLKGPHPWSAGKVTFDAAGNMLISDFTSFGYYANWYEAVYAPPYNKRPIRTFPMWGPAVSCALTSAQADLYCANIANGEVDVYSYPGGTYEFSFTNGLSTWGDQGIVIVPGGKR